MTSDSMLCAFGAGVVFALVIDTVIGAVNYMNAPTREQKEWGR